MADKKEMEHFHYFPDDKRVVIQIQIQLCNWRQRNYRDSDPEMLSLYMIFEEVEKYELSLENYAFCGDEIMDVIEMDDHTMKIVFLADDRVETIVIKAQKEPCYYNIE